MDTQGGEEKLREVPSENEPCCGIDEAGRGPLAGPVTASAVVLSAGRDWSFLADSKKLKPHRRTEFAFSIMEHAAGWGIGWVWPEEIDRLNIHYASLLAMERAFAELPVMCSRAVVDGRFLPNLPVPAEAVVRGDALVPAVSAASILAKVLRDRWMERYAWVEPTWGFDRHKGYPTREHRELCRRHGPSPIHRRSFRISSSS
jgi:ribonuclease HII